MNKKLFPLLLLTSSMATTLMAQSDQEAQIISEIRNNAGKEFSIISIPDSLKNESAVNIALLIDQYIESKSGGEVDLFHLRVKLLDNAAVKDYSELSFSDNVLFGRRASSYRITSVRIIKANGKTIDLDLQKNAIKSADNNGQGNKVAIPNLEPGDILDYFVVVKEPYYSGIQAGSYLLKSKYPCLSTTIRKEAQHGVNLQWVRSNGAPGFTSQENDDENTIYTFHVDYMAKEKDLLWSYPGRTSPKISYAPYSMQYVIKHGADTTLLFNRESMLARMSAFDYNSHYLNMGFLEDYFKKNSKTIPKKDQKALVNEFFYLIRNPLYQDIYFDVASNPMDNTEFGDEIFYYWYRFLKDHKIDFEIITVPPRDQGSLREMPSAYSLAKYLKVKPNNGEPVFIGYTTPFRLPNDVGYLLEGGTGFSYNPKKDRKNIHNALSSDIRPTTTKEENLTTVNLSLNLNPDNLMLVDVKRDIAVTGHNKSYHQNLIVTPYDYLVQYDLDKYQVSKSHLFSSMLKHYKEEKAKFEQRKAQDYTERDKKVKEAVEGDNDVKIAEYKTFKLISPGMWEDRPICEYRDEFSLENVSKKAGPNIILELPKLIEKQTEIDEKEKNRKEDIYMNYARTYYYNFSFTIPEGYTVEGIEALNKKVESETGGFISTAKLEGNVLKITTHKYYTTNYVPADKFSTMFGFLQAALDFSKQKILLRKN